MKVFMDNFLVYGHSFDACLESFTRVLDRFIKINLVLNFEKCHFMVIEAIVLGHLVSNREFVFDQPCFEAFQELKKRLTTTPIL
ncbi:hypothetical protein CR513_34722, partial [Mucuna pruriens]